MSDIPEALHYRRDWLIRPRRSGDTEDAMRGVYADAFTRRTGDDHTRSTERIAQ
jgi:hypothetical protein